MEWWYDGEATANWWPPRLFNFSSHMNVCGAPCDLRVGKSQDYFHVANALCQAIIHRLDGTAKHARVRLLQDQWSGRAHEKTSVDLLQENFHNTGHFMLSLGVPQVLKQTKIDD